MKQFYKYILTLVTILLTTTPAWAVDCHQVTKSTFTTDVSFRSGLIRYYYYKTPQQEFLKITDNEYNTIESITFTVTGDTKNDTEQKFKILYKTGSGWQYYDNEEHVLERTWLLIYNAGSIDITLNNSEILNSAIAFGIEFTNFNTNTTSAASRGAERTINITDVTVNFAQHFTSEADGTTLEFEPTQVNTTCATTYTIDYEYNNTVTSCTWKSNNPMFQVEAETHTQDCSGTKQVVISFTPTEIRDEITGTITGTDNNGNVITIYVKGSSWGYEDPSYEWNTTVWNGTQARTIYVGETINNMITYTSSPADCNYTITLIEESGINNGDAKCEFKDNTFYAGKAGKFLLTVTQPEAISPDGSGYTAGETHITLEVLKRTTSFLLNPLSQCYTGDEFAFNSLLSTPTNNPDVPFTCTTGNESILKFENNKLIAVCEGTTTFTATQIENYKWLSHTQTLNITVKKHDSGFQLRQTEHTCKIGDVITEAQLYSLVNNEILPTIVSNNPAVVSFNTTTRQLEAKTAGEAIITISQPADCKWTDYTTTCKVIVEKHTPVFTWNDPVYFNSTVIDYFSTNNTATAITITQPSTDTDVAELYFSKTNANDLHTLDLTTYAKESSTTVTISQAENWYWYAKTETHTITPIDPNNHVTFTLTQDNYINVFQKAYDDPWAGSNGPNWSNGGIRFGDNGITSGDGGWNWNDKYIIIEFTGIPDTLTFTTTTDGSATTDGLFFYVAEKSPTQSEFTEIWNSTEQSNNVALKLNPDTRFIKLCYTGNLRGWFKNVKVTELNQFEARPDTLDFGTQYVDNPDTTKTFDFHYANAGYKVQLLSTDSLHFTVSTTYIDTIGGEKYGTVKDIQVTYHPTEVHNTVDTDAKILIWDEAGHQDTVFLVANTIKSKPTLYWTEDWSAKEPIVILNQHMPDTVAKSTNGYKVKYRSDDESILKIAPDSLSFIAVGIGETYITAHADSDRVYLAPDTIRKLFHVTDKQMQYIVWEDNLTDLCIGDNPIPLTAQVWVMTDAANNTWEYSPKQTAQLQYTSPNTSVVSVTNNMLYIHGKGELLLEASVPADGTYEMAKAQVPVRVYDCSIACTDADLVIPIVGMQPEDELHFDPYQTWDNEKIVEIDTSKGIPGNLTFTYRGVKEWTVLEGKIRVFESTDGGNTWNQVLSDADAVTPEDNTTQYSPLIPLSPNATHIKFERFPNDFSSVRYGSHYVQFITVLPAHYIKTEPDDIHFGNVYVGNSVDTTINVLYSSIRSDLQLAVSENHLSINKTTIIDECGAWDTVPLKVSLRADAQIVGAYHQYVTIKDPLGEITDTVHVYANVIKNNPTVTWNITTDTIRSSAEWETKKTAFASSGAQVFYEVTEGNQMDEYAYLNDNGKMILLRGGTITARAYIKETSVSNEVSKFHDFFIIVDPLFEDTHNDHNWLNDDNWNIGRTPWDTDSATIQAGKNVILSTHVTTQGLDFQPNSSIQIATTGGLSVGAQGIKGAATDGSSITIDNLKTGAGFLRISPEYTSTMPKTTVRYQTRSTLDTGANKNATWQYIGAPGANCQFTVDYITWLYQWSEPKNWQLQSGTLTLTPFAGYAITQYGKPTYELTAEPINKNQTIVLTKTPENLGGMDGNNLFANSYMAPIDVKKFTGEEFTGNVEKTFYIFNSGSWNDWNESDSTGNSIGGNGSNTPGQYCAIPVLSAAYLDDITTIPPMQGVYVIAYENDAKIHLNYDKHVWQAGNDTSTNMNEAMRAPHRQQAEQQMQQNDFLRLRIQVNSANSGADRMYIIQDSNTTSDYDNGYDAPNQFAEGMANIYTTESFGKMEVSCSNNIDSMYIGFQAGNDSQYTLTFSSIIGDSIYLKDLSNDTIFQVFEDGQYQFTAQPLSTNDLRFQVLLHPINEEDTNNGNSGVSTDIDNVTGAHIWHSHNHLYISNAPANSTMTLYNINGQLILSTHLQHSTHTIDLGYLQKGVYILQLGHQMYKFVCQ